MRDMWTTSSLQDSNGKDPECQHDSIKRTHLGGHGRAAVYLWVCPDCDFRETEGYEGEE